VLASNENDGALETQHFSLARDIVELVVFTTDGATMQTLREAVSGARRLWHVTAADKISDLLVAGEVGIVMLDVHDLQDSAARFIGDICRQFPDLVVLATGNRDAETTLAGLISAGTVYRFVHKPLSPGRARLFVDAAVRKHGEQRRRLPPPAPMRTASNPRILGMVLGLLVLIVAACLLRLYRSGMERLAQSAGAAPAAQSVAGAPAAQAAAAAAEDRERLLARAENALLEDRLDEAGAAIDAARKSGVEGSRIDFLAAQLAKSRERLRLSQTHSRPPTPGHAAREQDTPAQGPLAQQPLSAARSAIERRDFDRADALLQTAAGVASEADIQDVHRQLAETRHQADSESREAAAARPDLDAAVKQHFLADIVPASTLVLARSTPLEYPEKARRSQVEGWVELDFTVAETGEVRDIAVHRASAPGLFEQAAIDSLSQWRYQPVVRDSRPVPQRARIRIRFSLVS